MAEQAADRRACAGFTLIEAMVALVIVALGMMAVNMQLNRFAAGAIHLENKTLASWIASNKITELALQDTWPDLGDSDAEVEFAGRRWHCDIAVKKTPAENLRRVEVSVSLADHPESVIDKVTGFIEPPVPGAIGSLRWFTMGAPAAPAQGDRR